MNLSILGPRGTFSHEAALKIDPGADIDFQRTIRDVFETVEKNAAARGLVPLENSVGGSVSETLDTLNNSKLTIEREVVHPVVQHLAVCKSGGRITTILAHPQSYAQCENFVRENYPAAEVILTSSNGKSAEMLAENQTDSTAAILPALAIKLYELVSVHDAIQDNRYNVTRFVMISANATEATGYDRTSLSLYPRVDYPGLLHEMLGKMAGLGVNLSKIESRPSKGRLGDYVFYIDVQGHIRDERVAEAVHELEKIAFVRVLGSYPRQY
ncbi:MAG: prephenate dehydratase [Candidatus Glassbacteria bacterium]|nr:prephenate dehydratase [Candidatus Glassbacteria bacterium]